MKQLKRLIPLFIITALLLTLSAPAASFAASDKKTKSVKVTTQKELIKYLSDDTVGEIVFKSGKKVKLTIPATTGSSAKTLVINGKKTTVVNSAAFSSITIDNSKKYTEKAKGNSITVNASDLTLVIAKKASVARITASGAKLDLSLQKSAKVTTLICEKDGADITITAASKAKVNVELKCDAKVTATGDGKKNVIVKETPAADNDKTSEDKTPADNNAGQDTDNTENTGEIVYKSVPIYGENRNYQTFSGENYITYAPVAVSAPVSDTLRVSVRAGGYLFPAEEGIIGISGGLVRGAAYKITPGSSLGELQYSVVGYIPVGLTPGYHNITMVFTPVKFDSWNYTPSAKRTPFSLENINVLILPEETYDSIFSYPQIASMSEDGSMSLVPVDMSALASDIDCHAEYAFYDGNPGNKNPDTLNLNYSADTSYTVSSSGEKGFGLRIVCNGKVRYNSFHAQDVVIADYSNTYYASDGILRISIGVDHLCNSRMVDLVSISDLPSESGTYTMPVEFLMRGKNFNSEINAIEDETLPYTTVRTVTFTIP